MSTEYHVPKHAQEWLDRVVGDGGNDCGNCGAFRLLIDGEIERCWQCHDDAYNVHEVAESVEELP